MYRSQGNRFANAVSKSSGLLHEFNRSADSDVANQLFSLRSSQTNSQSSDQLTQISSGPIQTFTHSAFTQDFSKKRGIEEEQVDKKKSKQKMCEHKKRKTL